jgi:hypothetical protein
MDFVHTFSKGNLSHDEQVEDVLEIFRQRIDTRFSPIRITYLENLDGPNPFLTYTPTKLMNKTEMLYSGFNKLALSMYDSMPGCQPQREHSGKPADVVRPSTSNKNITDYLKAPLNISHYRRSADSAVPEWKKQKPIDYARVLSQFIGISTDRAG